MKHPVEQVGWLVIGFLLGGLMAYSVNVLGEPIISEQTVTTNGQMTTTVKSPPPLADWGCGLRARYSTDSLG